MITKSTRQLALAASLFVASVSFQSVFAADLGSLTSSISSATEAATSTVDAASKIDINTATAEQLTTISGIGTAIAESIIEYREENGDFSNLADLTNISGIGSATLAKILPYLTL